jgi:SAM-dependent methyltransferase
MATHHVVAGKSATADAGLDPEQVRLWKDPSQLVYHKRQFERPYESTKSFALFLATLAIGGGEALDVACGAGANIAYLSHAVPGFHWTGIDLAGEMLFPVARQELEARGVEAELVTGNLFELGRTFEGRRFDLVISTQTLSWLPGWEEPLEQMLAVSRGWIVVSSLFTDFEAEVTTDALDLTTPDLPPYHVNVYSLSRLRAYCETRGCSDFRSQDFDIGLDLPEPENRGLGTYTRTLASGRRLQFTGPVYLPWKFVAIRSPSRA